MSNSEPAPPAVAPVAPVAPADPVGRPRPAIVGCDGPRLSLEQARLFAELNPLGFILFGRNCRDPLQLRQLTRALRDAVGRPGAPVLIDQEGGRVARLRPPYWRAAPNAARFGAMAVANPTAAAEAAAINARLIAAELRDVGINVNCAPVLDLPAADGHPIIGDRAFSTDARVVAALGRAVCEGLMAGGVVPVIKHIPGHGRARLDSHVGLPVVGESLDCLTGSDFRPFKALAAMPLAMTAHVVYAALDPRRPATTSAIVINEVIRTVIGFDGVLVTDDISMGALDGTIPERARAALAAGCDIVLHCNGRTEEMRAMGEAIEPMNKPALDRVTAGFAGARTGPDPDIPALEARLGYLLERGGSR